MDAVAQLRAAVDAAIKAGSTRYAIAKGAGIGQATFARWLDENRDIRFSTAAKLASFLNLELRPITAMKARPTDTPAVNWSTTKGKKPKGRR